MNAKCFIGTGRNNFCTTAVGPFWIDPKTRKAVFPPEFQWMEHSKNRNKFNTLPAANWEIEVAYSIHIPLMGTKYKEMVYIRQAGLNYTDPVSNGLTTANNTPESIVYIPFWFIDGILKDEAVAQRIANGIDAFFTKCANSTMQVFVGVGNNHPAAIARFTALGIDYAGQWDNKTKKFIL